MWVIKMIGNMFHRWDQTWQRPQTEANRDNTKRMLEFISCAI